MLDDEHPILFDALNGIELLLVSFSITVFCITSYVILESQLLHKNFMRLYKCLCVEYCTFSISRFMLIVVDLANTSGPSGDNVFLEHGQKALLQAGFSSLLQAIRFGFLLIGGCCMGFELFERIIATINLKTYETWTNNWGSIFFISSHLIGGICASVVFFSEIVPARFLAILAIFAIWIVFMVLYLLHHYNMVVYKRSKKENSVYTLSQKYQISENIRAIRILQNTSLLAVACAIILVGLYAAIVFSDDAFTKKLAFVAINYGLAIYTSISQIVFVMSARSWRLSLKMKMGSLRKIICPSKISGDHELKLTKEQLKHLKTLDGQKMVFSLEKEVDVYFLQLKREWN